MPELSPKTAAELATDVYKLQTANQMPIFLGEIFLIFRGTTMANKKADVLTDARIGLTRSSTGFSVHCGFQHCFSSMLPAIRGFFTN